MNVKSLSVEECKDIINQDDSVIILDVRTENEHRVSKIANSIPMPLDELRNRINELDKNKQILVYCASGNRSQIACHILQMEGFDNCFNVSGGISAWQRAGFDIE